MHDDRGDCIQSEGTILVVDDEPAILELYADILRSMSFDVLAAEDGRRAVALFEAHSSEIDLVILDWAMPNMHGRECLEAMQQITPGVRVVIASGHYPDDPELQRAYPSASAILCKPFAPDVLVDAVRRTIAGVPVDTDAPSFFPR